MDQFLSWDMLATYGGALAFVLIMTQLTKGLAGIERIPTQVWSWLIAMIGLYPAYLFTDQLTVSMAVLIPFNAALVALAANGGFEALSKIAPGIFKTPE
jgi:hypothetical protein